MKLRRDISEHKIKRRYRLSFYSENTLNEIWSIRLTRIRAVIVGAVIFLALVSLISTIIVSTPLRTYLPGYIKTEQRNEYVAANIRLDSLEYIIAHRNVFFENLKNILIDDVVSLDSAAMNHTDSLQNVMIDSLIAASESEKEFIREFDDREQFNIAVLTPLAAERLVFASPMHGEAAPSSSAQDNFTNGITVTLQKGAPVASIYDGTVIDLTSSISDGIEIAIQHPDGFISKYRNLGSVYVRKGDRVVAAQRIATTGGNKVGFELWHNGVAVNPESYLSF